MDDVTLRRWARDDLDTLRRSNSPEMMVYLGGPETEEKLVVRHERYLDLNRKATAHMFRIVVPEHPEGVGVIGYWHAEHHGKPVYEAGWSVETAYQGLGIATDALREIVRHAAIVATRSALHAFPRVDNLASNAICAKADFTNDGPFDFEYPPGNPIVCNDWVHRL